MINNTLYNLSNESNTSMIINHFELDFILDIIQDNLIRRISLYQPLLPNIVGAIEQHYKVAYDSADIRGESKEELLDKRNNIYDTIFNILCKEHNLVINEDLDKENAYTLLFYLYDFLIANFKHYMVNFIASYIHKECDAIYTGFNLSDSKKNKDSSTLYGKKLYNNHKIAVINANIEEVVHGLSTIDIPFNIILFNIYPPEVADYLLNNVFPTNDFFKDVYMKMIENTNFSQVLLTDIRLALHQMECNNTNLNLGGLQ